MRCELAQHLKKFSAAVCVWALLAHGFWPLLPMPESWMRSTAGQEFLQVVCQSAPPGASGQAPDRSGEAPRKHPRGNPLGCVLCQYAHGAGGFLAEPTPTLALPTAPVFLPARAVSAPGYHRQTSNPLGARAPPSSVKV